MSDELLTTLKAIRGNGKKDDMLLLEAMTQQNALLAQLTVLLTTQQQQQNEKKPKTTVVVVNTNKDAARRPYTSSIATGDAAEDPAVVFEALDASANVNDEETSSLVTDVKDDVSVHYSYPEEPEPKDDKNGYGYRKVHSFYGAEKLGEDNEKIKYNYEKPYKKNINDKWVKLKYDDRIIIKPSCIITVALIFYRSQGIGGFGIFAVLYCFLLQVSAVVVLGLIPEPEEEPEEENPESSDDQNLMIFAVPLTIAILVVAWLGSFMNEYRLRYDLIVRSTGCWVMGPKRTEPTDQGVGRILFPPFEQWKRFSENTAGNMLCYLILFVDVIIQLAVVLVGARLIIMSDTLRGVITSALSSIFVVNINGNVNKMALPLFAGGIYNNIEISLDDHAMTTNGCGKYVGYAMIVPVIPLLITVVLWFIPYWSLDHYCSLHSIICSLHSILCRYVYQ